VKLFNVLRREKPVDRKAVGRLLDEIQNIEKKGPNWHYISAWLLSKPDDEDGTERDLDKAIEHLAEARLQRPDWADVYMLLGIVQNQMGKKKAALESFDEGVRQGARGLEGLGAYAHLLMRENRRDEAAKILKLVEKKKVVLAPQAKLLLISGHFSKKEYEQGMKRAASLADELRDAIKENESLTDVLLLAELLRQMAAVSKLQENDDETEKALDESGEMYLKAARMAPDRSRLWLTVISFLNVTGRAQEIGGVLAEAKEKLPPEKVAITMAACYQLLKRTAEAEQQYEKALREVKNNDRVPRIVAEFFLKQTDPEKKKRGRDIVLEIVEGKRQVAEKDLAWARRRWAAVLAGRGDHASYAEGMRLVGENLKMNPDSILDKRLKAKLLGNRPNLSDQAKAIAIFEKLVRSPATVPDDRYQLAQLYSTVGRWNDASRQMLPLLASERPDPHWLVFYIGGQIREGEYHDAEGNLKDLERLIRSPYTIARLRATIYSHRHRHNLAIQTIRDYVENASSIRVPRHSRARRGAEALESMARQVRGPGRDAAVERYLKQAEIYWREYVQKAPKQTKLLVAFLGQQGRREEALEIAEKAWNEDKTRLMAVKAVSLLTRGDASPDEIARVEKIVEGSIVEQGETVPLLLALAELRAIQKRYEDAERAYRAVLARDDAKQLRMLALNNLSVFLALRRLKLDEAEQLIEEAIELAGAAAPLLDSRATVRLTKGDWRGALSDLTLALADEPTGLRYFHQAQAYLAGKDKDKAREAMDAADSYGLKVEHLQPLERPAYRQLREALQ
jgi:tetratricopeptide (TPR) repeat protein